MAMELLVEVKKKSVVESVKFINADKIDRTRLAEELTKLGHKVSRVNVSYWIKTGRVPEEILPDLQKIDYLKVITNRKPYTRKPSK